jgi:hypothetical protein
VPITGGRLMVGNTETWNAVAGNSSASFLLVGRGGPVAGHSTFWVIVGTDHGQCNAGATRGSAGVNAKAWVGKEVGCPHGATVPVCGSRRGGSSPVRGAPLSHPLTRARPGC